MKRLVIPALALATAFAARGRVVLPNYLTDNMIVQQNATATLAGSASAGSTVEVWPSWLDQPLKASAGPDGKFSVKVSTPPAGGPWTISFNDGEETLLDNVLSGEVWLCSGQSNMEFPVQGWTTAMDFDHEIATAHRPDIRLLQVKKRTAFTPQDDIEANMDGWQPCSSAAMADFSAIAYFFARQISEELKVPVGVIDCTWGGTPAEAWTSAEGLVGVPGFENELAAMKRCNYEAEALHADYDRQISQWMALAQNSALKDFDKSAWQAGNDWQPIPAGTYFDKSIYPTSFDGIVWQQYKLNVPAECAGKPLTLHLGAVDDEDITYFNGKEIARGSGYSTPRHYTVPADLVKAGENIITLRISDFGGEGGFMGPADSMYAEAGGQRLSLGGEWNAAVGVDFSSLPAKPASVGGSSYPSVLYNAMASPLKNLPVKGVLWYQGCANVGRDGQYAPLFKALIKDWRKLWGEEMPFYFVQLAGYLQPKALQPDSEWAALRNAQAKALELPGVEMVTAVDLGHPADIHPRNKQDVAKRLANVALTRDYGRKIPYKAPRLKSVEFKGKKAVVTFDGKVEPTSVAITGFILGDKDARFATATAKRISDNAFEISSERIDAPAAVRYNWADYPGGNLFSTDGLPVEPFASDK